jgi:NADPH-dependent curcumin reductase CurA
MVLPAGTDPVVAASALGTTGLTAWVAVSACASVVEGDVVLVSSAAGATGHVAAQLWKARGATGIGLTSNDVKAKWLKDDLGACDHTINYRTEDVEQRVRELTPDGITVYIDMVGGKTTQAAINTLRRRGRMVLVGQMSLYGGNTDSNDAGASVSTYPYDLMPAVLKSVCIQGMLYADWADQFGVAVPEMMEMLTSGKVKSQVDLSGGVGIDTLPTAFALIFNGANKGKVLTKF